MSQCRIGTSGYNLPCGQPATFGVYWIQTGEDEVPSCALHLAKAVRQQAVGRRGESTFKVRILPKN